MLIREEQPADFRAGYDFGLPSTRRINRRGKRYRSPSTDHRGVADEHGAKMSLERLPGVDKANRYYRRVSDAADWKGSGARASPESHQRRDCAKTPRIPPTGAIGEIAHTPEECPLDSTRAVEGSLLRRSNLLPNDPRALVEQIGHSYGVMGIRGHRGAIDRTLLRSDKKCHPLPWLG